MLKLADLNLVVVLETCKIKCLAKHKNVRLQKFFVFLGGGMLVNKLLKNPKTDYLLTD